MDTTVLGIGERNGITPLGGFIARAILNALVSRRLMALAARTASSGSKLRARTTPDRGALREHSATRASACMTAALATSTWLRAASTWAWAMPTWPRAARARDRAAVTSASPGIAAIKRW